MKMLIVQCFCRCRSPGRLCHISNPICTSTLRNPSSRVSVRTGCNYLARVYKFDRAVQYLLLESPCLSSTLPILYVQIFEEDPKGRLDVPGRHPVMYDR